MITTSTENLRRIAAALNAEVLADMAAGVVMTRAHAGKIEFANACTDEIDRRRFAPSPAVVFYMGEARRFAGESAKLTALTLSPEDVQARDLLRRRGALCVQLAKVCRACDLAAA